jgi:hypothetical protein
LIARLTETGKTHFADQPAWQAHLGRLAIAALPGADAAVIQDAVHIATEGTERGSFLHDAVVLSDDAGQFVCCARGPVFPRRTGFVTLDRRLARLHANKAELPMVLQRPEIPLHTNGSENDIRCQVTSRKVSAGTRSDARRDCRDAFLALAKTCSKYGVAFWDYLVSRLLTALVSRNGLI